MAKGIRFEVLETQTPTVRFVNVNGKLRATPAMETKRQAVRGTSAADLERAVRDEGARRLKAIGAAYSAEERETWPEQVREASAFVADTQAAVPFLSALASLRSETVAELAALILTKSVDYKTAAGTILSAQSALLQLEEIPVDFTDDRHWI